MTKTLTKKQQLFIKNFSINHCAADAARRAGYSPKTARQMASENLSKPYVVAALRVLEDAVTQKLGLTREKVLLELQEAIVVAKLKGDPAAMISGWREIGKMCGFYSPERHAHTVQLSDNALALRARYEAMSDNELCAVIDSTSSI